MKKPRLDFKSKGENLKNLAPIITRAGILPLVLLEAGKICVESCGESGRESCGGESLGKSNGESRGESGRLSKETLREIRSLGKRVIVRSSALSEDTAEASNAGAYLSLANVDTSDTAGLLEALRRVGESMQPKARKGGFPRTDSPQVLAQAANPKTPARSKNPKARRENLILIQPMLENLHICGVAFSVDKDNGAPYFCVSYDRGSSDSVTSGAKSASLENLIVHRDCANLDSPKWGQTRPDRAKNPVEIRARFAAAKNDSPRDLILENLLPAMLELEEIFDCRALDVEFAFDKNGALFILQVRPLVMQNKPNLFAQISPDSLRALEARIAQLSTRHPCVLGDRGIFGVMPDWNPAEIIGLRPKTLALSLYKELVTDNIWAYQRDNYGYRNLRSHPLMYSFLGVPYIDVRLSFNSFIPKTLDETIANKLVNYYLDSLAKSPHLHDKIEFEIVFSCYDFGIANRLEKLKNHGFNQNELKRIEFSLLNLTNGILNAKNGLYLRDLSRIDYLDSRFLGIMDSPLGLLDKIYWLVEDCKRFGTLPFAGVARAAFVATQMLNSLTEIGFFSVAQKEAFLASLSTVNKELSLDVARMQDAALSKEEFLAKYGHLRAGSYNILSPTYSEAYEEYFGANAKNAANPANPAAAHEGFQLDSAQKNELEILLRQNGLLIGADELFSFFRIVIEGRELAKFRFTKFLSKILDLIAEFCANLGISKEDAAHLNVVNLLGMQSSVFAGREALLDDIARNKKSYLATAAIKLPPLIQSPSEIFCFRSLDVEPNFITQKAITAPIAAPDDKNLSGKIILISSADPGYDYLFANNIAGLITCYGGANSHMAVRCSELSLPAVIGVGEEKFGAYKAAKRLKIDAANNQIFIL